MRRYASTSNNLICFATVGLSIALCAVAASPSEADMLAAVRQIFDAPDQTPHPAVVHIIVREQNAISSGSGTLIYVDAEYGYVLTNWHVVRSAERDNLIVIFPDGFQSAGTILKMDETWDLALLRIWRPSVAPMPISNSVPVVGEEFIIAGYGQDKYRAARGQCRFYASPDSHSPQEMIEVSVEARQGDSGGPIINQRGELAAVLFGSGRGMTTGTHIGRIASFLRSSSEPSATTNIAPIFASNHKSQNATTLTEDRSLVNRARSSGRETTAAAVPMRHPTIRDQDSDRTVVAGPPAPTFVPMTSGDSPRPTSAATTSRHPHVALSPVRRPVRADRLSGGSESVRVSDRQRIRTSAFVPALSRRNKTSGDANVSIPHLGVAFTRDSPGTPRKQEWGPLNPPLHDQLDAVVSRTYRGGTLLHHLKSVLAIIGAMALILRFARTSRG